jgi:AcrR family transcriptional regulator
MRSIATAAGVAERTLYLAFPSNADLLSERLEQMVERALCQERS